MKTTLLIKFLILIIGLQLALIGWAVLNIVHGGSLGVNAMTIMLNLAFAILNVANLIEARDRDL